MKLATTVLVITVGLVIATPTDAAVINLVANMDGAQANAGAGTGSAGTGTATMTFDTVTKILSWSITWTGLTGTPSAMHFHGPALPGANAGVQVGVGIAGPPVVGSTALSAAQESDLLSGLWYLNLHTNAFPGGEIRGQVQQPIPTKRRTWGGIKILF